MLRIASERESLCSVQWFSISPHMSSVRVKDIFLVTPILFLPEPSRRPPLEKTKPNCPSLLATPTLTLLLFNIMTLLHFDLGNLIQMDLFSYYHVSTWIYNISKAIAEEQLIKCKAGTISKGIPFASSANEPTAL